MPVTVHGPVPVRVHATPPSAGVGLSKSRSARTVRSRRRIAVACAPGAPGRSGWATTASTPRSAVIRSASRGASSSASGAMRLSPSPSGTSREPMRDAEQRRDDDALRPALVQRGRELAPRAVEALLGQDELVGVAEDP